MLLKGILKTVNRDEKQLDTFWRSPLFFTYLATFSLLLNYKIVRNLKPLLIRNFSTNVLKEVTEIFKEV